MRRLTHGLLGLIMALNGVFDLMQPEALKAAMDALSMPHYLLLILGGAKIIGAILLHLDRPSWAREWAYAGFTIWFLGGVACHVFSGHGPAQVAPICALGALAVGTVYSGRVEPALP